MNFKRNFDFYFLIHTRESGGECISKFDSDVSLDKLIQTATELFYSSTCLREWETWVSPFENKHLAAKSNTLSQHYRKKGNEFYDKSMFEKSLQQYNLSILFAEVKDSALDQCELSLAYGNRAILFSKLKFNEICCEDIKRAFASGYPVVKRAELTLLYCKALALLDEDSILASDAYIKQAEADLSYELDDAGTKLLNEYLLAKKTRKISNKKKDVLRKELSEYISSDPPTLVDENPDIKGLSLKADITYSGDKGRYLVAAEDIYPGMTIGRAVVDIQFFISYIIVIV